MSLLQRFNALDKVSRFMVYGVGSYLVAGYAYGSYLRSKPAAHPPSKSTTAPTPATATAPSSSSSSSSMPTSVASKTMQKKGSGPAAGTEDLMSLVKDIQTRVIKLEKKL